MHSFTEDIRKNVLPSHGLLILLVCLGLLLACRTAFTQEGGGLDLSVLNGNDGPAATPSVSPENIEDEPVAGESSVSSPSSERTKFLDLIMASGWIGVILLVASVVAMTLTIRLCFLLRRSAFIPPELLRSSSDALSQGDVQRAVKLASASDSFFGQILTAGLRETDMGWPAVEKATEDAVASLTAKLYRRAEPLSVIGNVAPMLGLLGTVMGMVSTFGELAVADASGRNLANGIYFALVTTVAGLIVAIPVLVAHSLVNGRIASLASEAAGAIDRTLEPVKRGLATSRPSEPIRRSTPYEASDLSKENTLGRPVRGLQEIPEKTEKPLSPSSDSVKSSSTGRPSLSLKNRRSDGE